MTGFVGESTSRRRFVRTGVALGLAGAVAGCGDGGDSGDGGTPTPTPTPGPQLEISRIQFVAERPSGYRDYQPVEDKTYSLGGAAWVYFEPAGVASEPANSGDERVQLMLEATFTDADGTVVKRNSEAVGMELTGEQTVDSLFLWAGTPLPSDAATGTWQVEIELTDEISGATASITREFEVEGGDGSTSYLELYRSTIESETDARIRRLEMRGSAVTLEYESIYRTRSGDWEGEIGFLAGVYAGLVARGWRADPLSATTIGSDGSTATWRVDRSTALAFANDEISNQEFAQRVFDTMSIE